MPIVGIGEGEGVSVSVTWLLRGTDRASRRARLVIWNLAGAALAEREVDLGAFKGATVKYEAEPRSAATVGHRLRLH